MKAGNLRIKKRMKKDGKASYEYYFEIDPTIDPKTGKMKRQRISRGGYRTKKEANDAGNIARSKFLSTGSVESINISMRFDTLSEIYLGRCHKVMEPTSVNTYETYIRKYFIPVLGNKYIQTIKPLDIENLLCDMMNENRRSKDWIRTAYIVITRIFEMGVREGYLMNNPVKSINVKLKGAPSTERPPYTKEQIHALLEYCDSDLYSFRIYRIVVALEIFCGMRIGEVLGLTWQDIDFEKKVITVHQQMANLRSDGKSYHVIKTLKTESSARKISVTDTVIKELEKAREFQKSCKEELQEFYLTPQTYEVDNQGKKVACLINDTCLLKGYKEVDLVCRKRDGGFIQSRSVDAFNKAASKRLGFHVFNHRSRHSHGTYLLEAGATVVDIANRLGHSPDSHATYSYLHSLENKDMTLAESFESQLGLTDC